MGNDAFGINHDTIVRMAEEIAEITRLGVQVAVVMSPLSWAKLVTGHWSVLVAIKATKCVLPNTL